MATKTVVAMTTIFFPQYQLNLNKLLAKFEENPLKHLWVMTHWSDTILYRLYMVEGTPYPPTYIAYTEVSLTAYNSEMLQWILFKLIYACSLIKVSIYWGKNIVSIATPILVAMVMHSWKNMDYIIRNICHCLHIGQNMPNIFFRQGQLNRILI